MANRIPNQFHFVYGLKRQTEPFHLAHYLCLESCLTVNRPDRIFLHYYHEPFGKYWDLIKDRLHLARLRRPTSHHGLKYKDRRIEKYRYAHEADFIRLDALIEHGGIYADIDTIFVRPLPAALLSRLFVLGREDDVVCRDTGESRKSLCNAFIMSEPRAEFAVMWRREMEPAFDGSWSRHSTFLPYDLAQKHPGLIHIEPAETFYPYMWTHEGLRRLFEGCESVDPSAASVHLWAHLWWSEKRRDFSDFHAGLITEQRIRQIDTTYNKLARPFLPPENSRPRPAFLQLRDILRMSLARLLEAVSARTARVRRRHASGTAFRGEGV